MLCQTSPQVALWFAYKSMTFRDGTFVRQADGTYCYCCGTVRQSFLDPAVDEQMFVDKYRTDSMFRNLFRRCVAAMKEQGRDKDQHCAMRTQVSSTTVSGFSLRWQMAFVSADSFAIKFGLPLASVSSLPSVAMLDMEGNEVEGVLLKYNPATWPSDLPFAFAEAYTRKETHYHNFVHDKG